ncbi:amidohydrolase [Scopulibacillus darangshiensis]|uniref:Amidohydrolase n=2 Tax=Scopulibacillus darangshiensis TaxID=442528 RepID=A0A4R2NHB4_9BACL|nr:amidohydrolase [Scopulibacillus darangshiensis]
MMKTGTLSDLAYQVKSDVVKWRRFLHENPELSFHEEKTSQFIYDTLLSFGGLEVSRPTKTSVMARLIGRQPGKTLAIRADIDALPIQEENTFEFVSNKPGVMHACGHDGHTSILLGTAKVLTSLKEQIIGEVRFLFQHAEETQPGGAQEMVAAGVMENVDCVTGLHLLPQLEVGKIGIISGSMTASSDNFTVTIHGKGGHSGIPHQTIDSTTIAAQVVTNLQHIVSRNTDPLDGTVISVTKFIGGTSLNVIPDAVHIGGSIRTLSSDLRDALPTLLEKVIKGVTEAHGATYDLQYIVGYDPVVNDEGITKIIRETACKVFGDKALELRRPLMVSDDFSAFQQKAPGTYFWVGAGNEEKGIKNPLHHPKFTIDEEALDKGLKMMVHSTFELLKPR